MFKWPEIWFCYPTFDTFWFYLVPLKMLFSENGSHKCQLLRYRLHMSLSYLKKYIYHLSLVLVQCFESHKLTGFRMVRCFSRMMAFLSWRERLGLLLTLRISASSCVRRLWTSAWCCVSVPSQSSSHSRVMRRSSITIPCTSLIMLWEIQQHLKSALNVWDVN